MQLPLLAPPPRARQLRPALLPALLLQPPLRPLPQLTPTLLLLTLRPLPQLPPTLLPLPLLRTPALTTTMLLLTTVLTMVLRLPTTLLMLPPVLKRMPVMRLMNPTIRHHPQQQLLPVPAVCCFKCVDLLKLQVGELLHHVRRVVIIATLRTSCNSSQTCNACNSTDLSHVFAGVLFMHLHKPALTQPNAPSSGPLGVDYSSMDVRKTPPRIVIKNKELTKKFIDYWLNHLPDISDFPTVNPKSIQFWLKKDKTRRTAPKRLRPHNMLKGMVGCYTNQSLDFAISMNKWCVQFVDTKGHKTNLIPEFIVTMWCKYLTTMTGRPDASMNSAQVVLKYMMLEQAKVHRAWRSRLYRFSSGTTFSNVTGDLADFLQDNGVLLLRNVRNCFWLWSVFTEL